MTRYPKYARVGASRVSIPLLDGGINTKDSATLINDNFLSDGCNVWFDGQTLKTRPKINWSQGVSEDDVVIYREALCNITASLKLGDEYANSLITIEHTCEKYDEQTEHWIGARICNIKSGQVKTAKHSQGVAVGDDDAFFTAVCYQGSTQAKNSTGVYMLFGRFSDEEKSEIVSFSVFEIVSESGEFKFETRFTESFGADGVRIGIDELYKPLMYMNGKGNMYSYLPITSDTEYAPASVINGKNLLPSACRFQYMTDGLSKRFNLPITNVDEFVVSTNNTNAPTMSVTVDLRASGVTSVKEIDSVGNATEIEDMILRFDNKTERKYNISSSEGFVVYTKQSDGTYSSTTKDEVLGVTASFNCAKGSVTFKESLPMGASNNVEIICYKTDVEQTKALLDMGVHTLYGGTDGIFGGTRTFLAGYKNKMCWSNADEPTYFSENNYVGVGDGAPITALAKMDSGLVIFKKNSTFYTQSSYSDNSVTAQDLQNGLVVDLSTTHVYFPIYQISDSVGCDLPNTIRLCLNRLVFASSEGDVYCLVTASNASTRNIYCISGQIRRKMFGENNECLINKNAFSVVWGDYYILFCDTHAWALNYNKDSYRYVYSYTNRTNNTSTRYFTWWYWNFERALSYGASDSGVVRLFSYETLGGKTTDFSGVLSNESDENCECALTTKVFDLGAPDRYKRIEKFFVSVGNDIPSYINMQINTDSYHAYLRPIQTQSNMEESRFGASYGADAMVFSSVNRVKRFSITISATGIMSVDRIIFFYKMLGGVV